MKTRGTFVLASALPPLTDAELLGALCNGLALYARSTGTPFHHAAVMDLAQHQLSAIRRARQRQGCARATDELPPAAPPRAYRDD